MLGQHNTPCHESSQNWAQVSISEANISAVHRRTRSLQISAICLCFGWLTRDLEGKNPGKIHLDFLIFCWFSFSKKKYDKKKLNLFFQHPPMDLEKTLGCAKWHPFGTFWRVQVSFYCFLYTKCLSSLNFTHLLVEKDCEWLTQADALLQSKKPNRSSYSTKNLTWNSEHMMIFPPKKHILFPTSLIFSQSHLECMSIHFRTKMQHTFSLTEQIPQAEKEKCKS